MGRFGKLGKIREWFAGVFGRGSTAVNNEHWFWVWGAITLSLVLTAAGTFVVSMGARPNSNGEVAPELITWGILSMGTGFALNVINQVRTKRSAKQAEAKRTKHLTHFNDRLSSVIGVFVDLLRSDKDIEASDRFFSSAVREARNLVTHDGVRICVYELELEETDGRPSTDGQAEQADEPQRALVRKAFGGRADPPRERFTSDSPHGAAVVAIAVGTTAVPISDPSDAKVVVSRSPDAVWSSTLVVPLMDTSGPKGVMMIDTREPVVFTPEDISIGWTIATIISLGMGSLVQGGQDTKGEVLAAMALIHSERARPHNTRSTD